MPTFGLEFHGAFVGARCSLNTVTLYLAEPDEWQRLDSVRQSYGRTKIAGRRELAPEFPGWSVDEFCSTRVEAEAMLGDWSQGRATRGT